MALREAQKAIQRGGGDQFPKEKIKCLRIQTVEPWKRVFVGFFGLLAGAVGVYALKEEILWLAILMFLMAVVLMIVAVRGRRKTIDSAIDGIDLMYLIEALIP